MFEVPPKQTKQEKLMAGCLDIIKLFPGTFTKSLPESYRYCLRLLERNGKIVYNAKDDSWTAKGGAT